MDQSLVAFAPGTFMAKPKKESAPFQGLVLKKEQVEFGESLNWTEKDRITAGKSVNKALYTGICVGQHVATLATVQQQDFARNTAKLAFNQGLMYGHENPDADLKDLRNALLGPSKGKKPAALPHKK